MDRAECLGSGGAIYNGGSLTVDDSYFCESAPNHIGGDAFAGTNNTFRETCVSYCLGDLDLDGTVNILDLLFLLQSWGDTGIADIGPGAGGDGVVGINDLTRLLTDWVICD